MTAPDLTPTVAVTLKGTHTFADYLAGHRLNRRAVRVGLRVAEVVVGGALLLHAALLPRPEPLLMASFGVLVVVWGLWGSEALFRWRVRRRWERYPALQRRPREITISDEGLHGTDDASNPTLSRWDNFLRWKENGAVFLLYFSPYLWLALPKRLLRASDIDRLRALLREHIGGGRDD